MAAHSPPLHPAAARGYERGARDYDRGRPGYPAEVVLCLVESLGLARRAQVLDLGAGTGKLAEALLARPGLDLVAVEPVAAMRRAFATRLPEIRVLEGTAEAIPLPDASLDAVVCGQAFHWFDVARALAEIRRVLRPGGGLGLVWNVRDESEDWVARFGAIVHAHRGDAPAHARDAWRDGFAARHGFGTLVERVFRHAQQGDEESFVARAVSVSYVSSLPDRARAAVAESIRELLRSHPATRGRATLAMPYRTEVYWCRRR